MATVNNGLYTLVTRLGVGTPARPTPHMLPDGLARYFDGLMADPNATPEEFRGVTTQVLAAMAKMAEEKPEVALKAIGAAAGISDCQANAADEMLQARSEASSRSSGQVASYTFHQGDRINEVLESIGLETNAVQIMCKDSTKLAAFLDKLSKRAAPTIRAVNSDDDIPTPPRTASIKHHALTDEHKRVLGEALGAQVFADLLSFVKYRECPRSFSGTYSALLSAKSLDIPLDALGVKLDHNMIGDFYSLAYRNMIKGNRESHSITLEQARVLFDHIGTSENS